MKVVKNYFYNAGYQILVIIVPLLTSYYVSRTLLPTGVGINAFTNSIIQYFILFANMGIGYYGNMKIAHVRDDRYKLSISFWEIQIVKMLMTAISCIAFIIFMYFYTRNSIYMWAQSLNLIAVIFDISWFYQGIEDFKKVVLRGILVKILSMIAIFTFIKGPNDLVLYIILLALSTLLGNLTLWPKLQNVLISVKINKLKPMQHFWPMVAMFVPQIATQVYVQLNRTMVGVMISERASGYYQYSDNLIKLVLAIVTATGTVMLPHMANMISKSSITEVNRLLYKSFNIVSALSFPLAFGLASVSFSLAPLYYGHGYEPVGLAMFSESIVILFIGWSNVMGIQYLLPIGETKKFTVSITMGAIVNIVLNIPLIYYGGLNGAMISTVLSELAVTLYQFWSVRNKLKIGSLFKGVWKYAVASTIMFASVFKMNMYFEKTWLLLFIEVMCGAVIYMLIIIILKADIISYGVEILKRGNIFKRNK